MSNNKALKLKREMKFMGALLFCALIFSGCKKDAQDVNLKKINSTSFFAMDTVMEIQIEGDEELLTEAEDKVKDLEAKLSVTDESSQIYTINKNKIGRLTTDSADIMEGALQVCEDTEGALDISIYPVLKEWGFTTGEYKVPSDESISELLQQVDYSKIEINRNATTGEMDVVLPEEMEIDLGSVVKGYTGQMLADYFKENGVTSALINLGGNVQCLGRKDNGQPWKIAIKSPYLDSKTGILGVLEAEDTSIITSGGYERYFEEDGQMYWHILDPANGKPADNGLASVSIVGADGLRGDGLSTALFVKGLEAATDYWREHQDFDVIFITKDNQVYITPGLEDKFSLSSEYEELDLHIIEK